MVKLDFSMKGKTYKERLLFKTMVTRREKEQGNRQDLIKFFRMCNGLSRLKVNEFFTLDDNITGTREH